MHVLSIDPAPAKDAVVCDGAFRRVPAVELPGFCRALARRADVLLLWDAPLTGPPPGAPSPRAAYSQRIAERFFSRAATGYKTPRGISVLPYAGCPHWAITRASLGLPVCGRYGRPLEELPFRLTTDAAEIAAGGRRVVESHPAVAAWLWLRTAGEPQRAWAYKGAKAGVGIDVMWAELRTAWAATLSPDVVRAVETLPEPADDDALDAAVGWVLGTALAAGDPAVDILGDAATGGFALPCDDDLRAKFAAFAAGKSRRGRCQGS